MCIRDSDGDPPWGIFGGHDGLNAGLRLLGPNGEFEHWPAKFSGRTIPAGSALEITVPSSGGYGDPLEREPQQVISDIRDGFTTLQQAHDDYGVVIDEGSLEIDATAPESLRERMRSEQGVDAKV